MKYTGNILFFLLPYALIFVLVEHWYDLINMCKLIVFMFGTPLLTLVLGERMGYVMPGEFVTLARENKSLFNTGIHSTSIMRLSAERKSWLQGTLFYICFEFWFMLGFVAYAEIARLTKD